MPEAPEKLAFEFAATTYLGWTPERAKLASAILQVLVLLLLIAAIGIFLEWRLIAFEQHGCSAYCNCTLRMQGFNYTYVLP